MRPRCCLTGRGSRPTRCDLPPGSLARGSAGHEQQEASSLERLLLHRASFGISEYVSDRESERLPLSWKVAKSSVKQTFAAATTIKPRHHYTIWPPELAENPSLTTPLTSSYNCWGIKMFVARRLSRRVCTDGKWTPDSAKFRLHSSRCDKHQSGSPDMTWRVHHTAKWTQDLADSGVAIM